MKKLLDSMKLYLDNFQLTDLAFIKLCLCALGIIIGITTPDKRKKPLLFISMLVFIVTYIPIMKKFLSSFLSFNSDEVD